MRQGPDYHQYIKTDYDGVLLRPPMELEHELGMFPFVIWHDNGDGTYTLTPTKE